MKRQSLTITDCSRNIPAGNGIIERAWRLRSREGNVDHVLLPTSRADLIMNFGDRLSYDGEYAPDLHIAGLKERPVRLNHRGVCDLVGITFSPYALPAVMHAPAKEFSGRTVSCDDISVSRAFKYAVCRSVSDSADAMNSEMIEDICRALITHADINRLPDRKFMRMIDDLRREDIPPTVDDLCARSGYAKRTLERLFSTYIGNTPKEYLRKGRLNRVIGILKKAEASRDRSTFTAIAHDADFCDQSHMIREFRKFTGITPSGYRAEDFVKGFIS